tara:strand:- start:228 stop:470 length:243 start_codon:yes stop_codon:yes gene_type:complete
MEMQIVGVVHVSVDGATYSCDAQIAAEDFAREKGLKFRDSCTLADLHRHPHPGRADDCTTLHLSLTNGLPSWGYTFWLVG